MNQRHDAPRATGACHLRPRAAILRRVHLDQIGAPVLACTAFLIAGLGVVLAGTRLVGTRWATGWCVGSFAGHAIGAGTVYAITGIYSNDAKGYDVVGQAIARRLHGDQTSTIIIAHGKEGWVWILGYLYRYFGHLPQLGLIINATCMGLLPAVIGYIVRKMALDGERTAIVLATVAPPLLLWGSLLLRESLVMLLSVIVLAASTRFAVTRSVLGLLYMAASMAALYWVRGPLAIILTACLVIGLVLTGRGVAQRLSILQYGLIGISILVVIPFVQSSVGNYGISLAGIDRSRLALSHGANSSFGTLTSSPSLQGSLVTAIKQFPAALLGPFPWQWSISPVGLLTAVDSLTWIFLVYLIVRTWSVPSVRRWRWLCATPTVGLILALAIDSGNYGTLIRIRASALVFVIPLVAAPLAARISRRPAKPTPTCPIAETPIVRPSPGAGTQAVRRPGGVRADL